ncbi:methionine aminotransferase [Flavobacterium aciduliphilum]|uniref:Methionine aminotransferase n=1 Tax=Flavobacterium aciduliphilum TaxID=1101402 RepID=A0A328YQB8_9FLAO|nr:methionine aminotransferase [Flavobacterium aciduliphilum]RAR75554.1 methionine aminotransferase [Flavobacterium aciduliphilum]
MSKLPHIGTSIFSTMSHMANEHNAINLSQGFPNFPVDNRLKNLVAHWSSQEIHQYLPMAGFPPLLEKIAILTQKSYGRSVHPNTEVLITAGATEGIFATLQALVHPKEEVIILDPSYDCYETPILLGNAIPKRIPLKDDFTPNWELIGNTLNANTKMIIINNPHNPSGRIWSEHDFTQLEQLVTLYPNLLILADEVYEYITFEQKHRSINQREQLKNRSIIVSSFGKSFHITGWKIGYLIAPEPLMNEIKKVHQFLVFSVNSMAQYALNDYMELVNVNELGAFYQHKRDFFRSLLHETPLELLPSEGSYFQVASYASLSKENDLDFTKRLVTEYGVAAVPLSPFYADNKQTQCIRFCFAKEDHTLQEAAKRLRNL